jgi:hypothetical protein
MKTTILSLITLSLLAPVTFASEAKTTEQLVLESLVVNSGQITLVSEEGTELESFFQLPELIAGTLRSGYRSASANGFITLSNVSADCKESIGARGADQIDCHMTILNGDFEVSKNGISFEGPSAESSISFEASFTKAANGKLRPVGKKFKAMLAG